MDEVGAGHDIEQLAGEMRRAADTRRPVGQLCGLLARELDEFLHGADTQRGVHDQNIRQRGEQRDRRKILDEVETEIGRDHAVDGVGDGALQQRVAVLRCMRDEIAGDVAAGPAAVLHHELLAEDSSTRAAMSPEAPGPKPMMMRTGWVG